MSEIKIIKSAKYNNIVVYSNLVEGEDILKMIQDVSSKNGCRLIAIVNTDNPLQPKEKMYIFSR